MELAALNALLGDVLSLGTRAAHFTRETRLLGSLPELDSMAVLSVLTRLEEQYDITIADDEISAEVFETVGSLLDFLKEKRGSRAS